jgi:aminopeptidase N
MAKPRKAAGPSPIHLKDYRPSEYLIDDVTLDVALDPAHTRINASLAVRKNPKAPGSAPLRLDGEHLELSAILLDGKALSEGRDYERSDTELIISKPPSKPFRLDITTYVNPDSNKTLQGLYRSRGVYCTQCEAQGFRRITYFLDRPDVLATYTCRIEADAAETPVLLANGNPVERGTLDRGKRHYAVWKDPHPKPSYLFALVGGDLSPLASSFRTQSGRDVDLRIYVEHGKESRAAWAMDCLKRSMRWDEVRFGREYDLDVFNIVAVSDFNMGAMENKGLNIFNDRLILASPDTATDAIFEHIEAVVAHEYFHNWTGNRITCREWFQLCLKEGLTVFRDQEFSADERSATVQRITDVRHLKAAQFPEDAGPLAHPVRPESYIEINNFYTSTVYEKGAELVRMIKTIVGDKNFREGMDLYFERHDGEAATIEDFIKCFEDTAGTDLTHFTLWYGQAGTPELVCALKYDKRTKTASFSVDQVLPPTPKEPKKKPLHIPVRVGLLTSEGDELPLELESGQKIEGGVLHVTKRQQTFRLKNIPEKPIPSLLRGFSAPVNLTINLTDADLAFLMTKDQDLFNRWQAANTYALRLLVQGVKALAADRRPSRSQAYARALEDSLGDPALEPAYCAEILRLPSQSDVARAISRNVDPSLIQRAHRHFSSLVGTGLGPKLEKIYKAQATNEPFSPNAEAAGRRALRLSALALLTARGTKLDAERLSRHYFKAGNMTDQAHALFLLCNRPCPASDKALKHFYDAWKDDHLVIDTWFAAQAQSPAPDTLDRVRTLTDHPLFSQAAPNKVRALVGTFAAQNPVQFNRADGRGYQFVADQVLSLDTINPQIAARILATFRNWRALEQVRRTQARRALQRVAKTPRISRDTYEIVSKMLDM